MPHFASEPPFEAPCFPEDGEPDVSFDPVETDGNREGCWSDEVVVVRGEDRDDLRQRVHTLRHSLQQNRDASLQELASALNIDLQAGGLRLAVVASSCEDLAMRWARAEQQLADPAVQEINDASGIYFNAEPLGPTSKIGFLFPGEGAPYLDMLGDLAQEFPEVRTCLDRADEGAIARDWKPFSRFFCLPAGISDNERNELRLELEELGNTMLSCMICSWALHELLTNLGIRAHAVAGHSAGELSALCAAGCLDPMRHMLPMADALRDISGDNETPCALLAAVAPRLEILNALNVALQGRGWREEAFLAMDNCPHQVIVAGTLRAIQAFEDELRKRRVLFDRLPFDRPYHTPLFEGMVRPLSAAFASVTVDPPHTTIYSCSTAQPFPQNPEAICEIAVRQWVTPVEFSQLVRRLHDDGVRILIEVGPRGNLTSFVEDILRGERFLTAPVNVVRRSGTSQLNHLVARLAAHDVPVNFEHLYHRRQSKGRELSIDSALEAIAAGERPSSPSNGHASPSPSDGTRFMSASAPPPNGHKLPVIEPPHVLTPPPAGSPTGAGATLEQVVARYQDAMDSFLEIQRGVMTQFLEVLSHQAGSSDQLQALPEISPVLDAPGVSYYETVETNVAESHAPGNGQTAETHVETPFMHAVEAIDFTTDDGATAESVATREHQQPNDAAEELLRTLPLLGEVTHYEPGQSLGTRRTLDLQEDWFGAEHTVGGRKVSRVDPSQNGLPIMPMTFSLEMMSEGATVLYPSLLVLGLDHMALMQGLVFDQDQPPVIEMEARVLDPPPANDEGVTARVFAEVFKLDPETGARPKTPVVSATVLLGEAYPPSPPLRPWDVEAVHASPITLDQMYKNLFHGEQFQGVTEILESGENNIAARCVVLPNDKLFRSNPTPKFVIDPVFLDVVMHPLAGWHLEQANQAGRIMLPYELEKIRFYCPSPQPGEVLTSRGVIDYESARRFFHAIEAFDDDGRLWCRLRAKYWRFYLPFGEYNFHGPKDTYFLSRDWLKPLPARLTSGPTSQAWAMSLDPSQDMMQPAMCLATAQVTLTRDEFRHFRSRSDAEQSPWLFSRVAAKDAVRSLWRETRGDNLFAADIELEFDAQHRLHARLRGSVDHGEFPRVDCDYRNGRALGVATWLPRLGVALRPVGQSEASLVESPDAPTEPREAPEPNEAQDRFPAARAAVARAALGPDSDLGMEVLTFDPETEVLTVRLDEAAAARFPDLGRKPLAVYTQRYEDVVAAVTFCELVASVELPAVMEGAAPAKIGREQILADVIGSLRNLRGRQYSGEIGPDSLFFGNLGFVSIDVIVLWETLENLYERRFPYQELLERLRMRSNPDLRIGELVDFLERQLNQPENTL